LEKDVERRSGRVEGAGSEADARRLDRRVCEKSEARQGCCCFPKRNPTDKSECKANSEFDCSADCSLLKDGRLPSGCTWYGGRLPIVRELSTSGRPADAAGRLVAVRSARSSEIAMTEPVDVLIIGAGAAGAAFAWSLADTRMNILCLEQGGLDEPGRVSGMRTDWEASQFGDFALSPNARGRREDYPVNDSSSPIQVSNFNAGRRQYDPLRGALPALPPSDSACARSTASRTTGRSTTRRSSPGTT
jgi:hypothetical protein